MIGFDLTSEQKALQERARRFSKEVIQPVAAKHDRDGTFPVDVMKKAHQEGFLTPLVPKNMAVEGWGFSIPASSQKNWQQAAWGSMSLSLSAPWRSIPSSGSGQGIRRNDFSDLSVQSILSPPTA